MPCTRKAKLLLLIAIAKAHRDRQERLKKTCWVKPWLSRRHQLGSFAQICAELQVESESDFRDYLKMSIPVFFMILEKIKPFIGKESTRMRDPIPPGARLEATILFLTGGMPYNKLKWSTRISQPNGSSKT